MNHLLVVPLNEGVPESFLNSLRQAGWRISVTSDPPRAKQLLQKGDIDGVIIEFGPSGFAPERLKVLRCVHEFCPNALIVMLNSGAQAFTGSGANLVRELNMMDDTRCEAEPRTLDLYHLSPAQKRIAQLVAQAYPNREIARRLKIKEQSVRNEISRIFKKMGVWNRVELALLMRNGNADAPEAQVSHAEQQDLKTSWPAETKTLMGAAAADTRELMT
jgi:DNA-binding CsgD family transcriptional regulator